MFNILVVDDEVIVSRGLSESIEWENWGCKVCGIGNNGLEGKSLVNSLKPDIVITDITMPGMNGLELSEYIHKHNPEIVTIILSGYNEFEFARAAMRNNVLDYLLKPIDKQDLRKVIFKAQEVIRERRNKNSNTDHMKTKVAQSELIVESGMIMKLLINGNKEIKGLREDMIKFDIHIDKGQVILFELYVNKDYELHHNETLYQFGLNNILFETFKRYHIPVTILDINNKSVVVAKFDHSLPDQIIEKRIRSVVDLCLENITTYLKRKAFVGIGLSFKNIEGLYDSYKDAVWKVQNGMFWGINDLQQMGTSKLDQITKYLDGAKHELFEAIKQGNETGVTLYTETILTELKRTNDRNFIHNIIIEMIIKISRISTELNLDVNFTEIINQIHGYKSYDELCKEFKGFIERFCFLISERNEIINATVVEKIRDYLKKHFTNPNLNLQAIAQEFQLSPSYLSRIFKKKLGLNFHECLSLERVENARVLMLENQLITIQKVANSVGFTDGKYFGQVFKKYYNMSPKQYRKQYMKLRN